VTLHGDLGASQLPPRHSRIFPHFTTEFAVVLVVLVGLITGAGLHILGADTPADFVWAGAAVVVLGPLVWSVARSLVRRDVGVDAIALLAIAAALVLGEYLTAVIVSLMLAGGNALEASANARARRELHLLVERAPRIAHRRRGTLVEEVTVEELVPGDVVIVRAGEVVPADGLISNGAEVIIDTSALTGEPLPVTVHPGGEILSGTMNAADAFDLVVTRPSAKSAYAAIVRLVVGATNQRAPFVRLADRYAAFFLPVTILVAGGAWVASGDPTRMLAVLVVATPCPLILAAPIALVSGLSRAARVGVIVKGVGVIEQLGRARTVLFDKTGTLTLGSPEVERIVPLDGVEPTEALRLAASLDQLSAHVLAEALVHDAERRGLRLTSPTDVREQPGSGIAGTVDRRAVVVGAAMLTKLRRTTDRRRRRRSSVEKPRRTQAPHRCRRFLQASTISLEMYARDVEKATARLHELRRAEWEDLALAALAFAAALVATQFWRELAVPLFLGGLTVGALGIRALWGRWDVVDRLAGERDAYVIPEVLAYASREATMERRRSFAAIIRGFAPAAGHPNEARLGVVAEELESLTCELEDEGLELDPVSAVDCFRLLSDLEGSPLLNPDVSAEELRASIRHIRRGFSARRLAA
jgi:cation transport ATPase